MNFTEAIQQTWGFFREGGFFMILLAACSLVALSVIVYKILTLTRKNTVPQGLAERLDGFEELLREGKIGPLQVEIEREESALARLCGVAIKNAGRTQGEVQEAVQSSAREEIISMNSGLSALDVVITIAPLLGLLGTASGLVTVFGDLGGTGDAIGRGIAMALSTTIVGIAVCVPSVIAHSYFSRKVETMAARLEVLLGRVVSACHQHVFFRDKK